MVDLELWRAKIGLFNLRTHRSSDGGRVTVMLELMRACLSCYVREKWVLETKNEEEEETQEAGGAGVKWNSFDLVETLLSMLIALLFLRLLLSGDVELNPGPGLGEYNYVHDV